MKANSKLFIIVSLHVLIILVTGSARLSAEGEKDAQAKISYSRYIENIRVKLPDLKKNRIAAERARNTLYGAGSADDITMTGEAGYGKSDTFSAGTTTEKKYITSKLGLSKKFSETGTNIGAGVAYDRYEYDRYSTGTYYSPSVYVNFSQSLLKNAFGIIDRYAVNNAKMLYGIERLRETESDKTSMNYYRKLYFKWIEYREELRLINSSVETAEKLSEYIKGRARSGMSNSADIYSAAALVLKYRIAGEEIRTDLKNLESELELFLGSGSSKIPSPETAEFHTYYSESSSKEYEHIRFERTVSAEIYRLTKENLAYSADVNSNRLLPQFDIVGQYTKKANDSSFSGATGNMNSSDYYLGFSMSYPLQNTESRSKAGDTQISIREINAGYEVSENSYRKSLETIINNRNDSALVVSLREKRIEALEKKYEFEYQKYRQSQLDLETLLNTSIEITTEKISLLQLKKQMIENYIDYLDLTATVKILQ